MNRYEHVLRPILREVGVPEDLVFVAMAESGFNPKVRSRVGAAGMWQFMEGTGRVYGLERTYWIDERHDIERATYAAATYLKDLRTRFGSWEMALAAFNGGPGSS
jgi:membrane-bound lytic murein transglycosylase D